MKMRVILHRAYKRPGTSLLQIFESQSSTPVEEAPPQPRYF
jgi:hypothetical protein